MFFSQYIGHLLCMAITKATPYSIAKVTTHTSVLRKVLNYISLYLENMYLPS